MFRPRDGHDLRARHRPAGQPAGFGAADPDPHSNSIAIVQPLAEAAELRITCSFTIEHAHAQPRAAARPGGRALPFAYSVEDRFDLEHYLRPHHDDPKGELTAWARQFIRTDGPTGTRELLVAMNQHIRERFAYAAREEEGTQTPLQTLARGGSCRDFALLMMEAARRLGIARASSRATSTTRRSTTPPPKRRAGESGVVGAGSTHACCRPTCRRRLAALRSDQQPARRQHADPRRRGARPQQAPPIAGTWFARVTPTSAWRFRCASRHDCGAA